MTYFWLFIQIRNARVWRVILLDVQTTTTHIASSCALLNDQAFISLHWSSSLGFCFNSVDDTTTSCHHLVLPSTPFTICWGWLSDYGFVLSAKTSLPNHNHTHHNFSLSTSASVTIDLSLITMSPAPLFSLHEQWILFMFFFSAKYNGYTFISLLQVIIVNYFCCPDNPSKTKITIHWDNKCQKQKLLSKHLFLNQIC